MALIQIFAKPPVEGKVKTRLIPDLGASVSTNIYHYCLDYTLNLVRQSGFDYQILLSEDSSDPIFQGEAYYLQQVFIQTGIAKFIYCFVLKLSVLYTCSVLKD